MAKTQKLNGKSIRQKPPNGRRTFYFFAYASFVFSVFKSACSIIEKLTWSLYILTEKSLPMDIGTYNDEQRKLMETKLNNTLPLLLFLFMLTKTR